MITLTPLSIPTQPAISIALNILGLNMSSGLSLQLENAADTDQVVIFGSDLSTLTTVEDLVTSAVLLCRIGFTPIPPSIGINQMPGPALSSGGMAPIQVSGPQYSNLYALYNSYVGAPSAGLTLLVTGQETAGTAGGGGGAVTSVTGTPPIVVAPTVGAVVVSAPTLGVPTTADKGVVAITSPPGDQQAAVAAGLTNTPKGYVQVLLNGVSYDAIGSRTGGVCFFSSDGGVTAQAQGSITAGAILYWNQSQAFPLNAVTDVFDFLYNA